jgi:hypothetical protein
MGVRDRSRFLKSKLSAEEWERRGEVWGEVEKSAIRQFRPFWEGFYSFMQESGLTFSQVERDMQAYGFGVSRETIANAVRGRIGRFNVCYLAALCDCYGLNFWDVSRGVFPVYHTPVVRGGRPFRR